MQLPVWNVKLLNLSLLVIISEGTIVVRWVMTVKSSCRSEFWRNCRSKNISTFKAGVRPCITYQLLLRDLVN